MNKRNPSTKRSRWFLKILGITLSAISVYVYYDDGFLEGKILALGLVGLVLFLAGQFAPDRLVKILETLFTGW